MNKKYSLGNSIFFFCSVFVLVSCAQMGTDANDPITIHLFKRGNSTIPSSIDKNKPDGWTPILDVDLSKSDLIITESDIINYDSKSQEITLKANVSSRFEYNDLGLQDYSFFIIALGESPVVGGIILPSISAVRVSIPILQFSQDWPVMDDKELEIRLGSHVYGPSLLDDLDENIQKRLLMISQPAE